VCPNCSGKVAQKAAACPHCGNSLNKFAICPDCNGKVPMNEDTCPHCNYPVWGDPNIQFILGPSPIKDCNSIRPKSAFVSNESNIERFPDDELDDAYSDSDKGLLGYFGIIAISAICAAFSNGTSYQGAFVGLTFILLLIGLPIGIIIWFYKNRKRNSRRRKKAEHKNNPFNWVWEGSTKKEIIQFVVKKTLKEALIVSAIVAGLLLLAYLVIPPKVIEGVRSFVLEEGARELAFVILAFPCLIIRGLWQYRKAIKGTEAAHARAATIIHVSRHDQSIGAFPIYKVHEYLEDGQLLPTDWCWHEGMDEWKPLNEVLNIKNSTLSD
jgi:hypothetical protein